MPAVRAPLFPAGDTAALCQAVTRSRVVGTAWECADKESKVIKMSVDFTLWHEDATRRPTNTLVYTDSFTVGH